MINLNEIIEMTATLYKSQFNWKTCGYYNSKFYSTTVHLKDMYLIKYARKDYNSVLNPFKARCFK